jgi:hypothetical protein
MSVTATTKIQFFWKNRHIDKDFRTGVSLHSHSMYSQESLEMIPRYTARVAYVGRAVQEQSEEFNRKRGFKLDFADAFWTPPYAPRQAYRLEEKQIQRQFQLPAMVSITDHDDIRAGTLLHVLHRFRNAPLSTEWTIPFGPTFFHLGVHNIPSSHGGALINALREYTRNSRPELLIDLLHHLNSLENILVVLNHPLWDEKGIGATAHEQALDQFLHRHRGFIHALEVNGLRSWQENRNVIELGRQIGLPVVAGGDRHGREPNAVLNLSRAAMFSHFVDEVRHERFSHIVFMPQYHEPLKMRVLQTMIDIVRDYPENPPGRRSWSDRVFYRNPATGTPIPLASIWNGNCPNILRQFISVMRLFEWRGVRSAIRLALDDTATVWHSQVFSGTEGE